MRVHIPGPVTQRTPEGAPAGRWGGAGRLSSADVKPSPQLRQPSVLHLFPRGPQGNTEQHRWLKVAQIGKCKPQRESCWLLLYTAGWDGEAGGQALGAVTGEVPQPAGVSSSRNYHRDLVTPFPQPSFHCREKQSQGLTLTLKAGRVG